MINDFDIDTDLLLKQIVLMPGDRIQGEAQAAKSITAATEATTNVAKSTPPPIHENKQFALLTTDDLKITLLAESSNFTKIITSQKITNVVKYVMTDYKIDENLLAIACIWAIGLPAETEQKLLRVRHPNILISANPEKLVSKEEKLAMFEPLTTFVSANSGILSQM